MQAERAEAESRHPPSPSLATPTPTSPLLPPALPAAVQVTSAAVDVIAAAAAGGRDESLLAWLQGVIAKPDVASKALAAFEDQGLDTLADIIKARSNGSTSDPELIDFLKKGGVGAGHINKVVEALNLL